MQPLEIAIFAVVLTAVSLAAAQTAFLNLPEDPEEVSLINKVIGQLGMLAAGFALFLSPAVLGIDQSLILIMLVLAVAVAVSLKKRIEKGQQPQPEKTPPPESAISSHEPDPTVAWCGNCEAHTLSGKTTVDHRNEYDSVTSSYEMACCGHCGGSMLWNIPAHVRQAKNWTLGCATIIGLITGGCFTMYLLLNEAIGLVLAFFAAALSLPVLGMVAWLLFLRWQWCKWLRNQPRKYLSYQPKRPS